MAAQQQQPPPPGALGAGSSLLLSHVAADPDFWAAALLPRLAADGGAGGAPQLALACRDLRALVHGAQTRLTFRGGDLPSDADARGVPQHFIACSHVVLAASSKEDFVMRLPLLLEVLGRLPQLDSLALTLKGVAEEQPALLPQAVHLMRQQLSVLRSLELSCPGNADGGLWRALGRASQLTQLVVHIVSNSAGLPSLQHLSALSGLHQLSVSTWPQRAWAAQQDYAWISGLAGSLTELHLPLVPAHNGLAAISACTGLLALGMWGPHWLPAAKQPVLGEAECAALAALSQLTALDLPGVIGTGGSNEFISQALPALQQLQQLRADGWTAAALPALASLTRLSALSGSWAAAPAGAPCAACPRITVLDGVGPIPFEAFPQLGLFLQQGALPAAAFAALARHCSGLQKIALNTFYYNASSSATSLAPGAPLAERVAAIRGLAALGRLRQLQLVASDDAEVGALAACTQLTQLLVRVPVGSACTGMGLVQLGPLQHRLHQLVLVLCGLALSLDKARALLVGLQLVPRVEVCVGSTTQLDVVRAAAASAQAAGLALPAKLSLEVAT